MRIAIDVAQTCVEKAGCGYYADSIARALAGVPEIEELILYHHFGRWLNTDTSLGTRIDRPNVSSPFASLNHAQASAVWSGSMPDGRPLPGAPDIVHSCSFQAPVLGGTPLVFTVYDVAFWTHPEYCDESNRLICQRGILDATRNASGLIFISHHAKSEFEQVLGGWLKATGIPNRVVHLAPRVFPAEATIAREIPERFWLAVGSIEPRKNYDAILDAHERYWNEAKNPIPLVIAGSKGWKSAHIHKRLESTDASRVNYLGFVSDAELGVLYARATGLIFPSWYEGFGLPVCEAMAQGCPVICSNRASIPEVAGGAALVVEPDDVSGISLHMKRIGSDPALRERLVRAGREQAARFSWAAAARETLALYSDVLARPRAGIGDEH